MRILKISEMAGQNKPRKNPNRACANKTPPNRAMPGLGAGIRRDAGAGVCAPPGRFLGRPHTSFSEREYPKAVRINPSKAALR